GLHGAGRAGQGRPVAARRGALRHRSAWRGRLGRRSPTASQPGHGPHAFAGPDEPRLRGRPPSLARGGPRPPPPQTPPPQGTVPAPGHPADEFGDGCLTIRLTANYPSNVFSFALRGEDVIREADHPFFPRLLALLGLRL